LSKPSEKKRRKQKKRQKAKKKRKLVLAEQRKYAEDFPEFVFKTNNSPPEFVELIKKTIKSIDLRDRSLFAPIETTFFRAGKHFGLAVMKLPIERTALTTGVYLALKLGQSILSRIPREELLRWIPYNDVQVLPCGRNIHVVLRSLCQRPGPYGTIYHSRHRPTLVIDGQPKVIGFTRHAIENTCKRIVPTWRTYRGLGDAFALFDECVHFERCDLHNGQMAFTFVDNCAKGFFSERYVYEVLGSWDKDEGHYYYRVGYCPAEIVDEFVVAKTLLFPGYVNTPEYGAILHSRLPDWKKKNLIERLKVQDVSEIRETGDFSLVKLFHDHGAPQVIHSNESFFRDPF